MIIRLMIIQQLLSIYYLPDSVLGLYVQFNHALSLQDRCDYSHFIDEETKAQKGSGVAQSWQVSELGVKSFAI